VSYVDIFCAILFTRDYVAFSEPVNSAQEVLLALADANHRQDEVTMQDKSNSLLLIMGFCFSGSDMKPVPKFYSILCGPQSPG